MKRRHQIEASPQSRRRGFVLVVVVVIVTMVAFAGFAFVNTMSDEYRAVHTNGDLLAAEQALASAERMLLNVLAQPDATILEAGGVDDNPELFQEQFLAPKRPDEAAQPDPLAWRFSVVSPNRSSEPGAEETGGVRFGLENESARLNLSSLMRLDALAPETSREVLLAFPGMTETIADSLLDWLDADNVPREFGAEADDYLDRPNPYQPRNGLPATLEELLLVRGVTRSLLFGPDEDRNFFVDSREAASRDPLGDLGQNAADVDGELQQLGWADLMTLSSAERNVDRFGQRRIDLNHPNGGELRERLAAIFPEEVVEFVLLYRQFGPVGGPTGGPFPAAPFPAAPGTNALPSPAGSLRYLIRSVGDLIGAQVNVTQGVTQGGTPVGVQGSSARVVPSPVTSTSRELLAELLDRTTTDPRDVIPGRININLASRPVLGAVPGLTAEMIAQIAARRATLDEEQLRTPAWLLAEQILTSEQFRLVLPHITTGGDVFRAQLIAWRPSGGPYRREEVLINRAHRPARTIVRHDLSIYGVAIPMARIIQREAGGEPDFPQSFP